MVVRRGWVMAIAAVLLAGWACAPAPAAGTTRLWEEHWTALRAGWQWVQGVELGEGRQISVERSGFRFRSRVLNPGREDEELTISGGGVRQQFVVVAGAASDIDTGSLTRGQYSIEGAPTLVLGEPRLVKELSRPQVLVFVLVDTLRAQAVNADLTPSILRALAGARVYEDSTANAPWTLPSVASMFTSRPVLDITTPNGDLVGIPRGFDTWASALRRAGFSGGAVVANYTVHVQNGFAHGFDTFSVPDILPPKGGLPDASWVVSQARVWLDAHSGEHAFLYLHLMDPHEPYRDHENGGPRPDLFGLAHRKRVASAEELHHLRDLYEGEVRHVDRALGPFLEGVGDEAVLVFTSDHGEALGEHGCWAHGFTMYEPVIRVPLMIRAPGLRSGAVDRPVQLLDLAPTILDLLGVPAPPSMKGRSLLSGGSQRNIVAATFSAGPLRWMWRRGHHKVVVRMEQQEAVTGEFLKPYEEEDPLTPGFFAYDLSLDPEEHHPGPIPDEIRESVVADFATSAGRLVPGLQIVSVGSDLGSEVELFLDGGGGVKQIWATGPVTVDQTETTIRLVTGPAGPFFAVSLAAQAGFTPGRAQPPWRIGGHADPAVITGASGAVDSYDSPGTLAWWNPERNLVVGSHDETMDRLRALGYVQ